MQSFRGFSTSLGGASVITAIFRLDVRRCAIEASPPSSLDVRAAHRWKPRKRSENAVSSMSTAGCEPRNILNLRRRRGMTGVANPARNFPCRVFSWASGSFMYVLYIFERDKVVQTG